MLKQVFLITSLLCSLSSSAQRYQKVSFDAENSLTGYYLESVPTSGKIEAVLLLLPGFGQAPESIYQASRLPDKAVAQNILVISKAAGPTLWADDNVIQSVDAAIADVISRHPQTKKLKWSLGGFSAGGSVGLRYAEINADRTNAPAKFEAVFTVDSPVDLVGIWNYFDRELERSFSEAGTNEARYASQLMEKELGTPASDSSAYAELTPFDIRLKQPGNEAQLKNMAVRVYHDVDLEWLIEERRRSARDANFFASSEMISRLRLMGNSRAEFMQSSKPGIRSNGERHPHSWSIVDEDECVSWIRRVCVNQI